MSLCSNEFLSTNRNKIKLHSSAMAMIKSSSYEVSVAKYCEIEVVEKRVYVA